MNPHVTYLLCAGTATVVAVIMVRLAYKKTIVTTIGNSIVMGGAISSLVTYVFYVTRWESIFGIIPFGIMVFFLMLQRIRRRIHQPLKAIVAISNAISEGRLKDSGIDTSAFASENELGELSHSIYGTYQDLSRIVSDIVQNIGILTGTVDVLVDKSGQLQTNSMQMKAQSANVSAASKEMNESMATVSQSAEQSAKRLNLISMSIEGMSVTVGEIARNTELARGISSQAVSQTGRAAENIQRLESSAQEANTIIDTINEIVDQTKLLALNATIEAARAGAYGKGFAVVADEVKQLANQTQEAVEGIRQKLTAMARVRMETISDIGQINDVIRKVDEVVSSIAASIEEQNISTKDIARNVEEINRGASDVNRKVMESAGLSRQMVTDMSDLGQAVDDVSAAGESVRESAGKLSLMSEKMTQLVSKFEV
ncbi:MAG: methyl-accepting chemotaxis protein [Thermodesulfobacteriota bacterium]